MPQAVKLFAGLLFTSLDFLSQAKERLVKEFGLADKESEILDFTFTGYYDEEMGAGIKRQFVSFTRLILPEQLPAIKLLTNEIEQDLALKGKRQVNIDPGYLSLAKVVLATTKDYSHRLYLGQGIYGEVTLTYAKGKFNPFPWTYPDYQTQAYRQFFEEIREIYKKQLQENLEHH